jgi:hypothetical protein
VVCLFLNDAFIESVDQGLTIAYIFIQHCSRSNHIVVTDHQSGYGTTVSAGLLVLVASETNADELNPLAISHTPTTLAVVLYVFIFSLVVIVFLLFDYLTVSDIDKFD